MSRQLAVEVILAMLFCAVVSMAYTMRILQRVVNENFEATRHNFAMFYEAGDFKAKGLVVRCEDSGAEIGTQGLSESWLHCAAP